MVATKKLTPQRPREPTHHEALGVPLRATPKQIRQNYQVLTRSMHPDKHGGTREANEAFARVTQAYVVLMDKSKREAYEAALTILTDPCPACSGKGERQRGFGRPVVCLQCNGTGRIQR